jgi:hypothetical protein
MDKEEVQQMIDQSIATAMDKHNIQASLISAVLGFTLLAFYAHGVIALVK